MYSLPQFFFQENILVTACRERRVTERYLVEKSEPRCHELGQLITLISTLDKQAQLKMFSKHFLEGGLTAKVVEEYEPKKYPPEFIHSVNQCKRCMATLFASMIEKFGASQKKHLFPKHGISTKFIQEHIEEFAPRSLMQLIWGFAKAGIYDQELYELLCEKLLICDLKEFKPQALSRILWALHSAEHHDERVFHLIAHHLERRELKTFSCQSSVTILQAMEPSGIVCERVFVAFADHLFKKTSEMTTRDICILFKAYSKAKVHHPLLFKNLTDELLKKPVQSLNGHDLSDILSALASFQQSKSPLIEFIAAHLIKTSYSHFKEQDIALILSAFADLDYKRYELFDRFARFLLHPNQIRFLNSAHACMVAHAFAKIEYKHSPLLSHLELVLQKDLENCDALTLTNTLWSFAVLQHHPQDFVLKVIQAIENANLSDAQLCIVAWSLAALYDPRYYKFVAKITHELSQKDLAEKENFFQYAFAKKAYGLKLTPEEIERVRQHTKNTTTDSEKDVYFHLPKQEVTKGSFLPSCLHIPDFMMGDDLAIEFEGPYHFCIDEMGRYALNGATILRNRFYAMVGIECICIPFFEWDRLKEEEKEGYLVRKINEVKAFK